MAIAKGGRLRHNLSAKSQHQRKMKELESFLLQHLSGTYSVPYCNFSFQIPATSLICFATI